MIQEEEIDIMIIKIEIEIIIITDMINLIIEKIIIRIITNEGMIVTMMKKKIRKRILVQVRLQIEKMSKKNNLNHLVIIDLMRKMKNKAHLRKIGKEVDHRKENKALIQKKKRI